MSWSTLEQLKKRLAQARGPALAREDQLLRERYAGQYVAYTDDWDGEELTRAVLAASGELADFQRLLGELDPQVRYRIKQMAVPPATPLPAPPPKSPAATLEQLKALTAKTPAQKEALRRADYAICDQYPGQHVAFIDEWKGEELVRTVLVAAADCGPFHEQIDNLPPDVRGRVECTQIPDPNVIETRPMWFE